VEIRAHRVQAIDQPDLTVLPELETGSEREVAAAAFARHDEPGGVNAEVSGVGDDPPQPGYAVVETRWERSNFWHRRRSQAVAEVDHDDGDAVSRDDLAQPRYMPS
jgi:hypothetical protein